MREALSRNNPQLSRLNLHSILNFTFTGNSMSY